MKIKKLIQAGLLAVLMLFSCISHAQQDNEINKIATTLQEELRNAGVTAGRSAIHLSTLNQLDLKKYDLDERPADAFFIKVNNLSLDIRSQSVDGLRNGIYW